MTTFSYTRLEAESFGAYYGRAQPYPIDIADGWVWQDTNAPEGTKHLEMVVEHKELGTVRVQVRLNPAARDPGTQTEALLLTPLMPADGSGAGLYGPLMEALARFLCDREDGLGAHAAKQLLTPKPLAAPGEATLDTENLLDAKRVTPYLFRHLQHFESFYGGGQPAPVQISKQLTWTGSVRGMRAWGFMLSMEHASGHSLELFVEPRVLGREGYQSSHWLDISYDEDGSEEKALASAQAAVWTSAFFSRLEANANQSELLHRANSDSAQATNDASRPIKTEERVRSSSCNQALFEKLYFPQGLPHAIDNDATIEQLWVDENQRCIVSRVRMEDEIYVDVALEETLEFEVPNHSQYLNLIHRQLFFPIAPERVDEFMANYAAALTKIEERFSKSELSGVFQRTVHTPELEENELGERGHREGAIELRINRDCNEECLFCNTPPDFDRIINGEAAVLRALEYYHARGYTEVALTGREPTLDPKLSKYIRQAKEIGYDLIGVQTNATTMSNRALLEEYVQAGLTSVQVSLHTFNHDTFEALIGKRNLLDRALEGMDNIMSFPDLHCCVLFVITRRNIDEMPEFIEGLCDRYKDGIDLAIFSPMAPIGWGAKRTDLIPRISEMKSQIGASFQIARARGLKTWIPARCGIPFCGTPESFWESNELSTFPGGFATEQNKSKPPICSECRFRNSCPGVWDGYIDAYGDEDIIPIPHG